MANVIAVCISEEKGVRKHEVPAIDVRFKEGVAGDAHGDDPKRRVSLLGDESVEKLRGVLPELKPGDFAENILTEGVVLYELPIGTKLRIGGTVLEVTQIGKECHHGCEIRRLTGDCVMPREGIFAEVVKEGRIKPGDEIEVLKTERYNAAVITVSDRCAAGEREDAGGPAVKAMLEDAGYEIVSVSIVPDETDAIKAELCRCASEDIALIVTTGGTGFSPRDVTPEATEYACERMAPGIPEAMRAAGLKITERAMLSRQAAGIRGRSLIINLPGSPKAAKENFEAVVSALEHGLKMLRGGPADCAGPPPE